MQFVSLGSGSRGNATLVRHDQTTLMVDCGFSVREISKRLLDVGVEPAELDGILVTHEHSDHIRGVASLARQYGLPVWASPGTSRYFGDDGIDTGPRLINVHKPLRINTVNIRPVPVPHDAREPCQFVFEGDDFSFGLLTDTGGITPHIIESYACCDALLLEFNHDNAMLSGGHYPENVKRRIAGSLGHLNNGQSCALLDALLPGRLKYVVAGHLSESNNSVSKVRQCLDKYVSRYNVGVSIAGQHNPGKWVALEDIC